MSNSTPGLSDLEFNLVTVLANKAKGSRAYQTYVADARKASSPECVELLERIWRDDLRHIDELKRHVAAVLTGKMGSREQAGQSPSEPSEPSEQTSPPQGSQDNQQKQATQQAPLADQSPDRSQKQSPSQDQSQAQSQAQSQVQDQSTASQLTDAAAQPTQVAESAQQSLDGKSPETKSQKATPGG